VAGPDDPGLSFVFEGLAEAAVAAGVEPEILRMMNVDNPRRALFGA
jgi:phosphotriesterase-related protein